MWGLAHKFLMKRGTRLDAPDLWSPLGICEWYGGLGYYMPAFPGMHGSTGNQLGTGSRDSNNACMNHHSLVNDPHGRSVMKAFRLVRRLVPNPKLRAIRGMFDAELHGMGTTARWMRRHRRSWGS